MYCVIKWVKTKLVLKGNFASSVFNSFIEKTQKKTQANLRHRSAKWWVSKNVRYQNRWFSQHFDPPTRGYFSDRNAGRTTYHPTFPRWRMSGKLPLLPPAPHRRAFIACIGTALPFLWPKRTLSVFFLAWKADTTWNIILNFKIIHITDSIMYMPVETLLWALVMKRPGQVSPGGE
jgi:hypothetical protein